MKNPITRLVFLLIALAYLYAVYKELNPETIEITAYTLAGCFAMLVLRAETLGEIFKNITAALKEKWSK